MGPGRGPFPGGDGERLFLETRFSQFFFAHAGGNPNATLAEGDPVTTSLVTLAGPISGPFAGQGMNCRGCHLVDDAKMTPGGGNRSYADFARHSPIPAREDERTETPRNSPALVNATLARGRPFFLHFDGEFPSTVALAEGTFTGRNFGWLPTERARAVANMADVIRGDDGTGALAQSFDGGPYRRVLAGTDPAIPKDFRLPRKFRIDVDRASDEQILRAVARLVAAYVESLEFENASPYDRFLKENILPGEPREFERDTDYAAASGSSSTCSRTPSSSRRPMVRSSSSISRSSSVRSSSRGCASSSTASAGTASRATRRRASPTSGSTTPARRRRSTTRCTAPAASPHSRFPT